MPIAIVVIQTISIFDSNRMFQGEILARDFSLFPLIHLFVSFWF